MTRHSFLEDLVTSDTLHVTLVRSTVPSGRIISIRLPEEAKDVHLIRAEDIPGAKTLTAFTTEIPLLADKEVRYQGEPVLLAASADPEQLLKTLKKVRLDYETDYTLSSLEKPETAGVATETHYKKGNSQKALDEAAQIFEEEYTLPGISPRVCGNLGAWAWYESGDLTVYVTSRWIHHAAEATANALGIEKKRVTLRALSPGPSEDCLSWYPSLLAVWAALCSRQTGKPCLLVLNQQDQLSLLPRSPAMKVHLRTGLGEDGRITGREIRLDIDMGAYPPAAEMVLQRAVMAVTGIYTCPHITLHGRVIVTNNPPTDISAGAGITPVITALETHLTRAALAGEKDPLWIRREYLRPSGGQTAGLRNNRHLETVKKLLDTAAAVTDYSRKHSSYELNRKRKSIENSPPETRRGIGLAINYCDGAFPGEGENDLTGTLRLHLDTKSNLSIQTSAVPGHDATAQIWKKTAASILSLDPQNITLLMPDTSLVPDTGPGVFSRNITVVNQLIKKTASSIQRKRFRSPLPISGKSSFRLPRSVTWDKRTMKGTFFHNLTWAAWVVEVLFDPVLLRTSIEAVTAVLNCGPVLDARAARSCLETDIYSVLQNINETATIFPLDRVIPLSITFLEDGKKESSGLSNLAAGGLSAAFLSALSQAFGHPINRFPVGDETLFKIRVKA